MPSEDCLSINVWRTVSLNQTGQILSNNNLPVLVWIYGGGYWRGSSSLSLYDPVKLIQSSQESFVFVSFNYRVGTLGFLATPEMQAKQALNLGLQDQIFALQWVQANIGAFGGDPTQVTLFGQSAGAGSVQLHMFMEHSHNLFSQAIMDSPYLLVHPEKSQLYSAANNLIERCVRR